MNLHCYKVKDYPNTVEVTFKKTQEDPNLAEKTHGKQ